jgi:N-acetyl-gamma-glutamyl-phosphate reductase
MTRVHVVGAAGYAAGELIRLLRNHPFVGLGVLERASHAGEPIGAHVPTLRTLARTFDPQDSASQAFAEDDVVVLAGGAELAHRQAPNFLEGGARVIDFSDAFRTDAASAGSLRAVYGFPERYRDALANARFVANPGCYPTAALLALLPLAPFASGIKAIVVDAKSGITGAGRTPAVGSLFAEVDGDVRAYGLLGHRHAREIEQEKLALGISAPLTFTPHVVPLKRGLLADCYAIFSAAVREDDVRAAFTRAYEGRPFLRLMPPSQAPSLTAVAGTNDAEIHVSVDGVVARIIVAIDNLGKGAAGQAVQCLNLMLGFPEETALDARAIGV